MTTVYDLLMDQSDLNVFIGQPKSRAWRDGPAYITFVNGLKVEEGGPIPHVGVDLDNAYDVLPVALYNAIIEEAKTLGANTIIVRMGTEDSPVERHAASFSTIDRVYLPTRYICRVRVAFTNLAKGSHNG
jgi:K+ transporter